MSVLAEEMRLLLTALQFLTRVPVPAWTGFAPQRLNRCVRHFPLVGAFVGAAGAAVLLGAAAWWPPLVAAVLSVMATAWLTGAFHEDGLADTFDALGGSVSRERALAIMKDSRIGSYGALALALVLGLRVALLTALVPQRAAAAAAGVVLAHALSRGAALALMGALGYAGDAEHAKAKPLATAVRRIDVAVATGWGFALAAGAVALGMAPSRALAALAAAGLVVIVMRAWLARRLGGYTGDTLGAAEQLAECAVLLALTAAVA